MDEENEAVVLLREIAALLQEFKPFIFHDDIYKKKLWSIDDIAKFMQMSKRTIYNMVKMPNFPAPVKFDVEHHNGHTSTQPRWIAKSVINWVSLKERHF